MNRQGSRAAAARGRKQTNSLFTFRPHSPEHLPNGLRRHCPSSLRTWARLQLNGLQRACFMPAAPCAGPRPREHTVLVRRETRYRGDRVSSGRLLFGSLVKEACAAGQGPLLWVGRGSADSVEGTRPSRAHASGGDVRAFTSVWHSEHGRRAALPTLP